ncbi:MAG TPA: PorV/PorQ family protein [candidate division WOR-3 bacterium]|uniref:PorV/PorQ family protein n=1 Tax=candidate division WOR-3 bacterium TaxID=2052148 RepID=A0A7V0T4U0_UNCW3|nr:PorV/PorQ family protein [candidate division WOR-3 bacterium]
MTRHTSLLLSALVATLLVVSAADAGFSKVGTTGANFLKIGVGRATAMGDAFVALADDPSASYFNPAGLALVGRSIQFNHVEWIADLRHDYLTAALPVPGFGTVGLSVTALTMGDMEQTTVDNPGTPVREDDGTGQIFGASDFAFAVSYARVITDKLSFGLTVKAVNQNIWDMSASAVGADLGLYYNTGFKSLRIGAAVQNYGTQLAFSGRQLDFTFPWPDSGPSQLPGSYRTNPAPLPTLFRFGIAYDLIEATEADPSRLTGTVELVHPSDINETVNFGFEYGVRDLFFLRGGYVLNTDLDYAADVGYLTGLTAGVGVKAAPAEGLTLGLDYTFRYFSYLNPTHRVLLTVGF